MSKLSPMTNREIEGYRVPNFGLPYGMPTYKNLFNGIAPATKPYSNIIRMASAFHGIDNSPTATPKINVLGKQLRTLAAATAPGRTNLFNGANFGIASKLNPTTNDLRKITGVKSPQESLLRAWSTNSDRKPWWSTVQRLNTFYRGNDLAEGMIWRQRQITSTSHHFRGK
jgi:hypothetical protein